jgi:flagellar biosynthesis/type III secretory pathway chaperone
MTTAAALIEILQHETHVMHELLQILQADQTRIIEHDVAGLEESNRAKEAQVLRLQALEQARGQLTVQLGNELGIPVDEVRVSRICPLLGDEGEKLRETADTLRALVASLGELVALSRGFLEQSILGIRSLLSLMQSLRTPEPVGYDASGRLAPHADPGALAIRREA